MVARDYPSRREVDRYLTLVKSIEKRRNTLLHAPLITPKDKIHDHFHQRHRSLPGVDVHYTEQDELDDDVDQVEEHHHDDHGGQYHAR